MNVLTRKAVMMALAGTALSVGAVSTASAATTMYNMNNFGGLNGNTDGWVWSDPANTGLGGTAGTTPLGAAGPNVAANTTLGTPAGGNFVNYGSTTRAANFVGTASPSTTPFGFNATSSLNWAISLSGASDTGQISAADSLARYGVSAEIDTGAGAWQDAGGVNTTTGAPIAPTGWKHQTDIGLIKNTGTEAIKVTLNPSLVLATGSYDIQNFGITVFSGIDTGTGSYSHHGGWNCPTCATPSLFNKENPFGTTGLTYLTHDATVDGVNGLSFVALAGQTYSIYLGGAGVGRWNANIGNYALGITTSAVPVPAAVWLLGSALAGMGVIGRRKDKASV